MSMKKSSFLQVVQNFNLKSQNLHGAFNLSDNFSAFDLAKSSNLSNQDSLQLSEMIRYPILEEALRSKVLIEGDDKKHKRVIIGADGAKETIKRLHDTCKRRLQHERCQDQWEESR